MAHAKPPLIPIPTLPPKLEPAGQIFVWGTGNFGQFGMGPNLLDEFPKPKKNMWVEEKMGEGLFGPTPGSGIINVAAGGLHSLFIDENGTIWSCGVNDDAALGRVTKDVPDPETPGKVLDVDVLTSVPHPLQTLVDENYKAVRIAAGDSISASISTEGQLRVWGSFRANEGSLGFASGLQHQFLPQAVLDGEQCVSVATGNNHLLVLTAQGLIYSWGAGEQGQLGRKILERRKIHGTVPERVILGNRLRKAVIVGAGNLHSFAVDEEGGVWGWGLNSAGQTGTGIQSSDTDSIVQTPRRVLALGPDKLDGARVIEISGGDLHTLFLTSDGRVFACGRSDSFQLGLPDDHPAFQDREDDSYVAEPVRVPFPDDHDDDPVVHVSAGTRFNAAVTEDGAMYAWGEGSQGEVGVGDVGKAEVPTVVVRREGGSWAAMNASCGGQHSLGLFRRRT
ncbi:regulator of chromosome condensation 1/beta-lactamase-inhibitor protein II [Amylostereum chailletii]|nr:regulator of chromosome condensation 1/beta-lactamase-inhibitor protein II [Amylostereum chailletii]